jgi:hypothetical protein
MVSAAHDKIQKVEKKRVKRRRVSVQLNPYRRMDALHTNADLDGSYFMNDNEQEEVLQLMKQTKEFLVRLDMDHSVEDLSDLGLTDPSDYRSTRLAKEAVKKLTFAKAHIHQCSKRRKGLLTL